VAKIEKKDQAAIVKTLVEAYAAGVRGGVLTPCLEDENEFRVMFGLSPASQSVIAEWGRTKGVRLPITLQKGLAEPEEENNEEGTNNE